jgi:TatD DNase family protein
MIDTHSHIYLEAFDHDRSETVERAKSAGVSRILLPNIDSESIEAMLACESSYPEVCSAMMGLHPTSVKTDYKAQLAIVEQWLAKRKFTGIGEIGMDLYWDQTFIEEQKEVLAQQLKWACEMDLPVVIHTRNAFPEIFEVFNRVYDARLRGVFHSFSGTYEDAQRILEMPGFYLGINGVVTYKNSNLPSILEQTGIGRVLLETDAPYLTPVPHRGKRNEPSYISFTRDKLAYFFNIDATEVDRITSENAMTLFGA